MTFGRRRIPAKKLARDYGQSLSVFMHAVLALISELDSQDSDFNKRERCREAFAALWGATVISLQSSALGVDEQEVLTPLLLRALMPLWKKHCGADEQIPLQMHDRARKYIGQKDARSQIKTATRIVERLLETLEVTERGKRRLGKRLSALVAHRMLGDIHRLNEVKLHSGIQLSTLASFVPWLLCG